MLVIIDFPITSMVNVNFELNSISIAVIRKMIVIAMTFNYHTRKIIKRKKNVWRIRYRTNLRNVVLQFSLLSS